MKFKRNPDGTLLLNEAGDPVVESGGLSEEEIKEQVKALADAELAPIKSKLDAAYAARDEATRKAAELEEAAKNAKMKALTDAGKTTEVLEMKLAELQGQKEALVKEVTSYKRDGSVKDSLRSAGIAFRNDRAENMAFNAIVGELVQNDQGQWVHKTGLAVKDYIANFVKDEDNSYLLAPKNNSGTGQGSPAGGAPKLDPNKKLTEMTQAEVMALAASGKLGDFHL